MEVILFISAVSTEFESYREPLSDALTRANVSVKIQEQLQPGLETTLLKLDDYIRECHAVVHLAGDASGSPAPASAVQALVARHPTLADKLPSLRPHIGPDAKPLSYTQWEAWLALFHGKGLVIATPTANAPRGPRHVRDEVGVEHQRLHLAVLRKDQHRHPEIEFRNVDHLSAQLLGSTILDWLVNAELATRLALDDAAKARFLSQLEHSRLPAPLFRHLWRQVDNRVDLLDALASAARGGTVEPVAASLPVGVDGEALAAAHLREAWRRVLQVKSWEPPARALRLPLARWKALATIVADSDGARPLPPLSGLQELLLWAMDTGEPARDLAALTQLLWLAAKSTLQETTATKRRAGQALLDAIGNSPALQPYLARAEAGTPPPAGPVRLHVELTLSEDQPALTRYWVQTQRGVLRPGTEPPPGASLGEQLKAIVADVSRRHGRDLHVALMAPLVLLCGRPEWTRYANSVGAFAGLQGKAVQRDFCDDWPVFWRWRDRLENVPEAEADAWLERAGDVVARAGQRAHLVCRFPCDPDDAGLAHLVVLPFVPPAPKCLDRNLDAFVTALLAGDPYMLWPGDEAVVDTFSAAVRQGAADKDVADLPEALRLARKSGALKHAVLFIDEPDRNPYDHMGSLSTTGDLSLAP